MSVIMQGGATGWAVRTSSRAGKAAEASLGNRFASTSKSFAKVQAARLGAAKQICQGLTTRPTRSVAQETRRLVTSAAAAQDTKQVNLFEEDGDVYAKPDMLKAGLRRHTISVFVADERGMINRVSGVFARRGFNIESLAVGLWGPTQDRALFTIVVIGEDSVIQQLVKQIYKLPNVTKVELLTDMPRVERGLLLIKVKAVATQRTEILDLAKIFRASVVDVSENSIMLAMSGDSGKGIAMQRAMSKYGVLSIARTGKVSLKRELSIEEDRKSRDVEYNDRGDACGPGQWDVEDGGAPAASAASAVASAATEEVAQGSQGWDEGGDVYSASSEATRGVWDATVLDPSCDPYQESSLPPGLKSHTLSIAVENQPGVLTGVTGVIARRGYNIQSLAVGPAERKGVSRLTLVVPATQDSITKLLKQLHKLVGVIAATDITEIPFVERELMLIKVLCDRTSRAEVMDVAKIFRAKMSDVSQTTATIEVLGDLEKMAALQQLLGPYGILEVARTGRVALTRDSGVDNKLLQTAEMDQFF